MLSTAYAVCFLATVAIASPVQHNPRAFVSSYDQQAAQANNNRFYQATSSPWGNSVNSGESSDSASARNSGSTYNSGLGFNNGGLAQPGFNGLDNGFIPNGGNGPYFKK